MFVLDTNVLLAMMGRAPPPEVAAWVSGQPVEQLFTTVICQAEILSGIAILPEGRRRSALEAAAQAMFVEDFEGRVLPFDTNAAAAYADLFTARWRAGRPTAMADLMIVAVARTHGATLATRNLADFEGCGIILVDPWNAA
ncbi:MAG TPA: type II toxin-antitoxin system VapC family toxin [Stellaceae bacterium]|nr:type II toxin-antitoxin system VapC family toxin [Stellaceae bacterium]